ncbi:MULTISPECIES: hypothetical protein [unclassified Meiothermus]|uniref:hypothetical protein n=1 Tax=unclassified Meiothermus TaxID=370471 RepID=UPI000D7CD6D6|nr:MULTISPECIES: hypothetical protein [unclassified Meiothermus]PZA07070.1 hypothetical protein DNA98_10475 [Meiothermus sp. Pnk-1]RYM40052.1 hypothetical protein EWH23_02455 [Meiothermus sp. PNK-Is4]
MDAWLSRHLEAIRRHPGPLILEGEPGWGAPYLIAALNERPLVWLELNPRDAKDPVVQGNKLAEAVARALGSPLFGYAMPYDYGLSVLHNHLELLGPFTFALSGAEYGVGLARGLLGLGRAGSRVILHFSHLPAEFRPPAGSLRLGPEQLALTYEEAAALAQGGVHREQLETLLESSGRAYERFLLLLDAARGLFGPRARPSPRGPRPLSGEASATTEEQAQALFHALTQQRRWIEALELASAQLPHQIAQALEPAAQVMWTRGTLELLQHLLRRLPSDPQVLRWRLAAALEQDQEAELLPQVEALLQQEEAPELRALYALALYRRGDLEAGIHQARRAAEAAATPLTLHHWGWMCTLLDPTQALHVLTEALRLAERQQDRYHTVLCSLSLSQTFNALGRYEEAADWAEWGLNLYRHEGLGHDGLRLRLLLEWAASRILLGQTAGLEERLKQESPPLESAGSGLSALFRSTLADLYLSQGQAEQAERIYAELAQTTRRREEYVARANLWARALLECGRAEEALQVARRALRLAEGLPPFFRRHAQLAHGMVLSLRDPAQGKEILQKVLPELQTPLLASRLAQAGLYLARAQLTLGEAAAAEATLKSIRSFLTPGGAGYLAGPEEAFRPTLALLWKEHFDLELEFLGGIRVIHPRLANPCRLRYAELMAVLALHPAGLNLEALTLAVYGETASPQTAKADLSRLRGEGVGIESKPYRLAGRFRADFLEVTRLLQQGQVRKALGLYRGPLLPGSEAPAVVEQREALEEKLRQAVLASGDPEAVWLLAERLAQDLELWERALELLPSGDPRRVLARAQVERLRRDWGA